MTSYDHFIRLLVLIGFLIGGLLLTTLFSGLLMLASGMGLADIMEMAQSGIGALSPGLSKNCLLRNTCRIFLSFLVCCSVWFSIKESFLMD